MASRFPGPEQSALTRVEACLARIAEREVRVGAFAHLAADAALALAARRDREERRGPLHGVPIAIKDVFDTEDMPTAYGSPIYAGHRPVADAAAVALLRAAGAIVLGKSVTTEFAGWKAGRTTNPHDPARTPGGSSSGSAAAVADGMVPLALGTQTGGSVIRPAAFCGVVGFKPSFGLVPRAGVKTLADSLDTVGVFARSVPEVAALARVLCGEPTWGADALARPRIGLHPTVHADRAEGAARDLLHDVGGRLARAGAVVRDQAAPAEFDALYSLQRTIENAEGARALAHEWHAHRDGLSAEQRAAITDGLAVTPDAYRAAQIHAETCRAGAERLFGDHDVLVTFGALGEAPVGLADTGDNLFNRIWTLLHVPCVTLPVGRGPNGMPLGVQLVARRHDDRRLLGVAQWSAQVLEA
ncbi:MAG: amidase [Alphaproteobacteria bacterium]|nr:amidase [Alphaproteobacteria bacterium]